MSLPARSDATPKRAIDEAIRVIPVEWFKASPAIYWADLLGTAALGWGSFAAGVAAGGWARVLWLTIATFALYRTTRHGTGDQRDSDSGRHQTDSEHDAGLGQQPDREADRCGRVRHRGNSYRAGYPRCGGNPGMAGGADRPRGCAPPGIAGSHIERAQAGEPALALRQE